MNLVFVTILVLLVSGIFYCRRMRIRISMLQNLKDKISLLQYTRNIFSEEDD